MFVFTDKIIVVGLVQLHHESSACMPFSYIEADALYSQSVFVLGLCVTIGNAGKIKKAKYLFFNTIYHTDGIQAWGVRNW